MHDGGAGGSGQAQREGVFQAEGGTQQVWVEEESG